MKKESKIGKSLEEKLRDKGWHIEKAQLPENESRQCDKCMSESNNFGFHKEGWFVEGSFYCSNHKEGATRVLEEIDKDVERRKLERESIIEERRKQSGLK